MAVRTEKGGQRLDVHATPEQEKLTLLCALDRIGRCTEEQLLRYTLEEELIDQFAFYLALGGLRDTGLVGEVERPEGKLLVLTPEGRKSLSLFGRKLRATVQEKLDQTGAAMRRRVLKELASPASWEQVSEGFRVHLAVYEDGVKLYGIELLAATREQAKEFCRRWPERSAELYQNALHILGGDEKEE